MGSFLPFRGGPCSASLPMNLSMSMKIVKPENFRPVRPECHCGCVERGSLAPTDTDPRAGSIVDFPDCRPPKTIPEQGDFEGWIFARYLNWKFLFNETFGESRNGRNRTVFTSGDYVYKLPNSKNGIDDNEFEASRRSCHLATCWIQRDGDGYPILIMERVADAGGQNHPGWTLAIDCQQVGYSRRTGLLVAYDFGYW